MFSRELPEKYIAKLLYGQKNKKYDWENQKKMEENWRCQKRNLFSKYNRNSFLKRLEEEKEGYKKGRIKKQNEKKNKKD